MALITKSTCGRCGVYRHLHPTTTCTRARVSFWWDRHMPVRHLAGVAWLALPEKVRWAVVGWLYERKPRLDWCEFVNCAYLDNAKDDYRGEWGCGCDVPLPIDVGAPRPGRCYCLPIPESVA